MRKLFLYLIILFTAFDLFAVEAFVRITSPINRGEGAYLNPYVIRSKTINFEVDVYGADAANYLYYVQIHMDGSRNCSTQWERKDLTYHEINKIPFSYTVELPGWFYIRVDIKEDGIYYIQDFEKYYMHVYCEVPPIIPYAMPYNPPDVNRQPVEIINILNATSGSGVYGDPYILNDPIVKFRFDSSYDPNGLFDLKNGLFLWCIETHGNHPIYSGGSGIRTEAETFFKYSDYQSKIYEWDIRTAPSSDNFYLLYFWIIDQYGVSNNSNPRIFLVFETSDDEPIPGELDTVAPAIPKNLAVNEMN